MACAKNQQDESHAQSSRSGESNVSRYPESFCLFLTNASPRRWSHSCPKSRHSPVLRHHLTLCRSASQRSPETALRRLAVPGHGDSTEKLAINRRALAGGTAQTSGQIQRDRRLGRPVDVTGPGGGGGGGGRAEIRPSQRSPRGPKPARQPPSSGGGSKPAPATRTCRPGLRRAPDAGLLVSPARSFRRSARAAPKRPPPAPEPRRASGHRRRSMPAAVTERSRRAPAATSASASRARHLPHEGGRTRRAGPRARRWRRQPRAY